MHVPIPTLFKCGAKDTSILHLKRPRVVLFQLTEAEYVCTATGSAAAVFGKIPIVSDPRRSQVLPAQDLC
jgi:hypothetical protein